MKASIGIIAALLLAGPAAFAQAPTPSEGPAPTSTAAPAPKLKVPPRLLSGGNPRYPAEALAQGHQGTVLFSLLIGTDGLIKEAKLIASSRSPILDKAAEDSLVNARFSTAMDVSGAPMEIRVRMPFEFRRWESDDRGGDLTTYRCRDFTLDNEWWAATWADTPGRRPELFSFLLGLDFALNPNRNRLDEQGVKRLIADAEKSWAKAEKACREKPDSLVVDHLKQSAAIKALAKKK